MRTVVKRFTLRFQHIDKVLCVSLDGSLPPLAPPLNLCDNVMDLDIHIHIPPPKKISPFGPAPRWAFCFVLRLTPIAKIPDTYPNSTGGYRVKKGIDSKNRPHRGRN